MTIVVEMDVGRFHMKRSIKGSEGAYDKFFKTSQAKEQCDKSYIYYCIEGRG
jgi:hypothetical protein